MKKSVYFLCVVSLLIFSIGFIGCAVDGESIVEKTYITPIWKGSRSYAPYNPEIGWAYYNLFEKKSYIYDGSDWQILAQDGKDGKNGKDGVDGLDGISIIWKGELFESPEFPEANWAYYNLIDGNSYIYDGEHWNYLAKSGRNGATGILLWLGSLDYPPPSEQVSEGYAYYNTTDKKSYVYNGYEWEVIAQDGLGIEWQGVLPFPPENPKVNWAYYDTTTQSSFIYNGSSWDLFAASGNATIYVSVSWQGTFDTAPENPEIGWAYYNSSTGCSYIYDGTVWNIIAKNGADGKDGADGSSGGSSNGSSGGNVTGYLITWKGSYSSAPTNPKSGWAYYNSVEKKSYIYDGSSWQILAQDGADGSSGGGGGGENTSTLTNWLYIILNTPNGNYIQYSTQKISTVNFGKIGIGSTVKTTTFWISINGFGPSSTLNLTGNPPIQISGVDASQFEIVQPSTTTTTNASSGTYIQDACIIFRPTSIGTKTATVTIPNDSEDCPNFSFTITGTGSYWSKNFDGGEGDGDDQITKLLADSSGNFYAIGYGYELVNDHSSYDWWIKKFNSTGIEQWEKKFDFYDSANDKPQYALLDNNENLIIASSYNTVKLNSSGTKLWELSVGGSLNCDSQNNIFVGNKKYSSSGNFLLESEFITNPVFDSSDNIFSNRNIIYKVNSNGENAILNSVSLDSTGRYNGSLRENSQNIFSYSVTGGKKYLVTWDGYYGTSAEPKTLYTKVSSKMKNANSYIFKDQYVGSGNSSQKITAPETGNVIVYVQSQFSNSNYSGTYALAVYENYTSGQDFSTSDWQTGNLEKNGSQTYSLKVTKGRLYIISANDSSNGDGTKTCRVKVSANYSDGTSIFSTQSSTWNSPELFFATKDDTLTVKVETYSSSYTGTYGITMKELNYLRPQIIGFDPGISNVVSICLDGENNVYVAGYESNKAGTYSKKDIVIKKFDSTGTEITNGWNKTIDYGHCNDEIPTSIHFDGENIILVGEGNDSLSGSSKTDGLFYVFDKTGGKITSFEIDKWESRSYYNNDYIGKDKAGNYYFLTYGYYLSKYSSSGSLQWEVKLDINSPHATIDNDDNIIVGGYGSNLVTSVSGCDWYIKKYSSDGVEL